MTLAELLTSLTEAERDYIATRDYGIDAAKHREQLEIVIARGGAIDMPTQYWFPYEVIELCKNHLDDGHEREFAACVGLVLKNVLDGNDKSTDIEAMLDCTAAHMAKMPAELQCLLDALFERATEKI